MAGLVLACSGLNRLKWSPSMHVKEPCRSAWAYRRMEHGKGGEYVAMYLIVHCVFNV